VQEPGNGETVKPCNAELLFCNLKMKGLKSRLRVAKSQAFYRTSFNHEQLRKLMKRNEKIRAQAKINLQSEPFKPNEANQCQIASPKHLNITEDELQGTQSNFYRVLPVIFTKWK
jgi:hypothetical protein